MYVMQNKEGNLQVRVNSERRKDDYIEKGFVVVSSDGKTVEEVPEDLNVTETEGEKTEGEKTEGEETEGEETEGEETEVEDIASKLGDMTIAELKAYAKDMGLELESTKKADIIAEIVSAQAEQIN